MRARLATATLCGVCSMYFGVDALARSEASSRRTRDDHLIQAAAVAPLKDFGGRRGTAFCSDFTVPVRARLARQIGGRDCASSMEHAFARASRLIALPLLGDDKQLVARRVWVKGNEGRVELEYSPGRGLFSLSIVREAGAWRIASKSRLQLGRSCSLGQCGPAGETLVFWLGLPIAVTR
jgi:hypothetical protein